MMIELPEKLEAAEKFKPMLMAFPLRVMCVRFLSAILRRPSKSRRPAFPSKQVAACLPSTERPRLPKRSMRTGLTCFGTSAKTFDDCWLLPIRTRRFGTCLTMRDCRPLPERSSIRRRRREQKIAISSISLAELVYLTEKNRLPLSAYEELVQALADPEHVFTEAVFTAAVVQSMRLVSRAEVPDMPDRIVAATAVYFDVPVVSRDRRIRAANLKTVW